MINPRSLLVFLHDVAAACLAWLVAYWLRFNLELPERFSLGLLETLGPVVLIQSLFFFAFGLYRGIWRFASLPDLKRIVTAVGLGALAVPMSLYMLNLLKDVPRSVLLLYPLLLVMMMSGSRILYRAWKDGQVLSREKGQPVLILGTGDAAATLLRDLASSQEWRAVGLLVDDGHQHGRQLRGVPILGDMASIAEQARRLGVGHAIIAMPAASAAKRRRAAELAAAAGLGVLTVPSFADLISGRVSISQVRKVELEDLLGRDQVQLDDEGLHRLLSDKAVLVTGAGGSIGSELCAQIARFAPRLLVFYDISELALYAIEQEFVKRLPQVSIVCIAGDVRYDDRLAEVFGKYRPDVVFHAAAYKHVPLMENDNAWQALRNNVLGTWSVTRAAVAHGVGKFVLISTDKAVNPSSVMGASKRLAEMVCQSMSRTAPASRTSFVMVRFGNVLGSSGSVIPKFREQIALGGPVTVTHPEVMRYFMLIPEAAQLVLQAGLMGEGGEIFVLDMGEPVKIVDLARDMIRLSGFSEEDIRIEFIGLRRGEKLSEELLADGEKTLPTPHAKLRVVRANGSYDENWLADLHAWLSRPGLDEAAVKAALRHWVPEYQAVGSDGGIEEAQITPEPVLRVAAVR